MPRAVVIVIDSGGPAATLCDIGNCDTCAAAVMRYDGFDDGDPARAWAKRFTWPGAVAREAEIVRSVLAPAR